MKKKINTREVSYSEIAQMIWHIDLIEADLRILKSRLARFLPKIDPKIAKELLDPKKTKVIPVVND